MAGINPSWKTMEGMTIIAMELGKNGTSQAGRAWQMYRYRLSRADLQPSWYSTFNKYPFNPGDCVNISYEEKPNPKNEQYPYKTIQKMWKYEGHEQTPEEVEMVMVKKYNVNQNIANNAPNKLLEGISMAGSDIIPVVLPKGDLY